ncbi:IgG-binding virulence factor TspB family protein [Neisseria gonorrhoeae]
MPRAQSPNQRQNNRQRIPLKRIVGVGKLVRQGAKFGTRAVTMSEQPF